MKAFVNMYLVVPKNLGHFHYNFKVKGVNRAVT